MEKRKSFFWWAKDKTYSVAELEILISRIKQFNAGVVDPHLSKHVDRVFEEWRIELNN